MIKFLRKILLFTSPLILIVLLFTGFLLFVSSSITEFKVSPEISEIFIGDSHVQCSINDSLLSNSKNLGQMAESFYFSYFKLKLILSSNPNIKKVYLGFSNHNLSNYYDKFINGEFSRSISPNYFYILPLKEQIKLICWNSDAITEYFKILIKKGIKNRKLKADFTFSGGYSNSFINSTASELSMDKRINFQYYTDGKLNDFSEINLSYLKNIIDLCQINNIHLVLFNAPLHPYYKKRIPVEYLNMYNKITKGNNLSVLDLSDLALKDNCFIPDGDHVSTEGALEVTKEIVRIKNESTTYKQ